MRDYTDLTDQERTILTNVWPDIKILLDIYEEITGAKGLDEVIYEKLWEEITRQNNEAKVKK